MEKEWIKIKETGQLFLEQILFSFDIPILFVCKNDKNAKFLCLTIDDETGKTVIAETDNTKLIKMLKDEITMESVFRSAGDLVIAEYNFDSKEIETEVVNSTLISEDLLPSKGAFLNNSDHFITEYISELSEQLLISYLSKEYIIPYSSEISHFWNIKLDFLNGSNYHREAKLCKLYLRGNEFKSTTRKIKHKYYIMRACSHERGNKFSRKFFHNSYSQNYNANQQVKGNSYFRLSKNGYLVLSAPRFANGAKVDRLKNKYYNVYTNNKMLV